MSKVKNKIDNNKKLLRIIDRVVSFIILVVFYLYIYRNRIDYIFFKGGLELFIAVSIICGGVFILVLLIYRKVSSFLITLPITIFFGITSFHEHELLLLFYFLLIYGLLLFFQIGLEKKIPIIIYIAPWVRFFWVYYFSEKLRGKSLFSLATVVYSAIGLILDTVFFYFYEREKKKTDIENKIYPSLIWIWKLFNYSFLFIYIIKTVTN